MERKWDRTIYITEEGEIIPNSEIKNLLYKTVEVVTRPYKKTNENGEKQTRIQTVRIIKITGKQLVLF